MFLRPNWKKNFLQLGSRIFPVGEKSISLGQHHTMPCAIIALATFMKPAMLAPFT